MSIEFNLTRKHNLTTTHWSGGTTTQLAIWPAEADYAARNFTWRVSTATVEAEESEFTRLPGISRILMSLEGTIGLEHQGHHSAVLEPFEQDSFMGDWTTRSYGRATDFNLMMAGASGTVDVLELKPQEEAMVPLCNKEHKSHHLSEVLYFMGDCEISNIKNEPLNIDAGDVLTFTQNGGDDDVILRLTNRSSDTVHIIRAAIFFD